MPLVKGKYPTTDVFSLLGLVQNVAQSNEPVFSNARIPFIGGLSDAAIGGSGIACAVPIPVIENTEISNVSIFTGATAAAKLEHQFAALYAGTGAAPALIEQSTDATTTAAGAKKEITWKLTKKVLITNANAPAGFIYAAIALEGETMPTAVSFSTAAGVNYKWTATAPLFWSMTAGSALAGTAAATLASPAAKVVAPLVVLS